MSDIKSVIRVEHPDIVLTNTVSHDRSVKVMPLSEAGTDPDSGRFLYHVGSSHFRRFDDGLWSDHTIAEFKRVIETTAERAIYSFAYTDQAKTFSPVISKADRVALEMENDGNAWLISLWMPTRDNLADIWEYAQDNSIDIDLRRVNEYASFGKTTVGLTETQREALLVAFEAGYFKEPRDVTLSGIADTLDISKPTASGLLRRGIQRLIISSLVEDS